MSRQLLERIDDFRFERRFTSRAETIRHLIEAGLRAKRQKPHTPPER
jgi:metal-responsive CopG/Arc/MetJ family transcriptional regulator